MERAGDQLLAGAGLAEDEHGRVGRGDLLDLGEDAREGGARAHDLVEAVRVAHLLLEDDVLASRRSFRSHTSRRLASSAALVSSISVTSVCTTTAPAPSPCSGVAVTE